MDRKDHSAWGKLGEMVFARDSTVIVSSQHAIAFSTFLSLGLSQPSSLTHSLSIQFLSVSHKVSHCFIHIHTLSFALIFLCAYCLMLKVLKCGKFMYNYIPVWTLPFENPFDTLRHRFSHFPTNHYSIISIISKPQQLNWKELIELTCTWFTNSFHFLPNKVYHSITF